MTTNATAAPFSPEQVERIMAHWNVKDDTCHDTPKPLTIEWPCSARVCGDLLVKKTRNLPEEHKLKAIFYIEMILRGVPFQLRYAMAQPMIHRFLDVWNSTGSFRKAMSAI
jgi:hypothetical protein